jgi:serine/threonine-protein kinase
MSRHLARVPPPKERDATPSADDPLLSFHAEHEMVAVADAPNVAVAGPSKTAVARKPQVVVALGTMAVLAVAAVGIAYFQVVESPGAAAPVSAPVLTGNVTFTSEPAGATVTVDGIARGVTPLKLAIPAGQHEAEIALGQSKKILPLAVEGHAVIAQHFEFAASAIAQTGRLDVTTDPPGARVAIDGTPRGNTPLSIPAIAVGDHRVTITSDRTTIQRSVTVAAGATAAVMATVAPSGAAGGWAEIAAPIELQVFEAGQLLGTTRASRLMLPAGRHDLEVANTAFEFRAPLHLDIAPGKTQSATIAIPNGTVSVNALPWAEVSIDGRSIGTTPLANIAVPIGTHEIVWRHPQLGERRSTVSVTARTPVRVGVDFSK